MDGFFWLLVWMEGYRCWRLEVGAGGQMLDTTHLSLAAMAQWEHGRLGSNFQSFREFESRWERKNFAQKFALLTD